MTNNSLLIWQYMDQNPPAEADSNLQIAWKWVTAALTDIEYNHVNPAVMR